MEPSNKSVNALLVNYKHSRPIEVSDFVSSVSAIGCLFTSFVQRYGDSKELTEAKLYVEKIEEGSIDIILTEAFSSMILPFAENMNVIFQFSVYLKDIINYFVLNKGEKPELDLQEYRNAKDLFTVTAGDNNGTTTIGAINKADKHVIYNQCTFNFQEGNSAQNQILREMDRLKNKAPSSMQYYERVLMTIYQMRGDIHSDKGNRAIIDDVSMGRQMPVVFETDELKERILHLDENPMKKAFLVDVRVMTINGKPTAYKVIALHDVIDID